MTTTLPGLQYQVLLDKRVAILYWPATHRIGWLIHLLQIGKRQLVMR